MKRGREAQMDNKKLFQTMLCLIERGAIKYEAYSWCFQMVDMRVMSAVFSDKKFIMTVPESEWNDGPSEAVAMTLAQMVVDGELEFSKPEDWDTLEEKVVIFMSDRGREIDMVVEVKNYDEKFRDVAVEGMYQWDGTEEEYCEFMMGWLKDAGYSVSSIEYEDVFDE